MTDVDLGFFGLNVVATMIWIYQYLVWILPVVMGTIINIVETQDLRFEWNLFNQKFSSKVGGHLEVPQDSNLILVCPHNVAEYYKIYWVPQYVFENCKKPENITLKPILYCTDPYAKKAREYTIPITFFSGVSLGPDFEVGLNYYLTTLSTGSKQGTNNTYQGACDSHNMKLNISIVESRTITQAPTDHPRTTARPPTRRTQPTPRPTTPRRTTTPSTTNTPTPTTKHTTHKPPFTDIPDPTDIVINVPDSGNTGVIEANSAASLTTHWVFAFAVVLSILHILNSVSGHR